MVRVLVFVVINDTNFDQVMIKMNVIVCFTNIVIVAVIIQLFHQ